MKRKLDKTKKSNIKCEHCQFFNPDRSYNEYTPVIDFFCPVSKRAVRYWNMCNGFEWHERYQEVNHEEVD